MKKITVDGNEACARTSYLFTEVAGIYPITPSSPMAEHLDEWSNHGVLNLFGDKVKVVEMESEAGAAGMVHGSLQAGCLTSTYTASQGLLLMIPNMYKIAGEMLPGVFHVAARSLSTHALSIFGDHQDVMAVRQTGFAMLASSSVQDASYLAAVAHLTALASSLPFVHFFDGFRTSHEYQKINVLENKDYQELLPLEEIKKFRKNSLQPLHPVTRGTAQNDDIYFQMMEVRNPYYQKLPDLVEEYMQKINQKAGTNYHPFQYYGDPCADKMIVAMGSVCEVVKEVIDALGDGYGLMEVHLYRPFSKDYFEKVLPLTIKKIAVLDRTKEPGSGGEPLYLDVVEVLKGKKVDICGGRYGLSSKNTTPSQIRAVFAMLDKELKNPFTIGITDDTSHLSLEEIPFKTSKAKEMLIYGYGSDGMVSACKSMISLVGNDTDQYVQGYYQYDSKKSGGVTLGHLRFSKEPIRSTYYVENPSFIAVTKDSYLSSFDVISTIEENGIFLVNTTLTEEELIATMAPAIKKIITERHIHFYTINAYELARKVGLKNKISMIMENVILSLSQVMDYHLAKEKLLEDIHKKFSLKGEEVVRANVEAIEGSLAHLKEIHLPLENDPVGDSLPSTVIEAMRQRVGNDLPTSAFSKMPDGTWEAFTTKDEKRGISDLVPHWIKENCIQCNQCSFVCPHGVVRPFLLNEEEYETAPEIVKDRCLKPLEKNLQDYYYCLGVSIEDCTGCGLCIKTCPGKKNENALLFKELIEERKEEEQQRFQYLVEKVSEKSLLPTSSVKGSQLKTPQFCFHGACAGCGETAYIKLLTQLFGKEMIVANATGCSSIYGASTPSMPYSVPWASSLFEDNAEYGYGMAMANETIRARIARFMEEHKEENPLYQEWLDHPLDYEVTNHVYQQLLKEGMPSSLEEIKEYLPARMIWMIGGDGWAYDIGFNGIDHVLASNENVNILVLDSQVYSNTGGQSSKASPKGAIAAFASFGKGQNKKDLARIAMSYPHVYVAQVNLGANPVQLIKAYEEAAKHQGPSLIIAYSPCISHGIKGGMENSLEASKKATKCGYFPTFRYLPLTGTFTLDSKEVDFDQYEAFLESETRYKMLKVVNPLQAEALLKENKENAMARYAYYQSLRKED